MTVGGNIGAPLSAQVSDSTPDTFHVVETSSFQLGADRHVPPVDRRDAELLARSPRSASERRGVRGARRRGSSRTRSAGDWAVINADDPSVLELARRGRAQRAPVRASRARSPTARSIEDGWIVDRSARRDRAARAARRDPSARAAPGRRRHGGGDGRRDCRRSAGRDDRGGRVRSTASSTRWNSSPTIDGVRFVNDSKATNVESALRSIESFDRGSRADHRRPLQGRRSGVAARAAERPRQGASSPSARRAPLVRRGARRRRSTCYEAESFAGRDRVARTSWRSRPAWCCSRRHARASTCSATTRSGDGGFKEEVSVLATAVV